MQIDVSTKVFEGESALIDSQKVRNSLFGMIGTMFGKVDFEFLNVHLLVSDIIIMIKDLLDTDARFPISMKAK